MGVVFKPFLVGRGVLKYAQPPAAAAPRSLTEITAGSGRFQGGAAYRGNKWRGGRILRATATIPGRGGGGCALPDFRGGDARGRCPPPAPRTTPRRAPPHPPRPPRWL